MTILTELTLEEKLLVIVDEFLKDIAHQTIVEQSRVVDFTLDIRNVINEN